MKRSYGRVASAKLPGRTRNHPNCIARGDPRVDPDPRARRGSVAADVPDARASGMPLRQAPGRVPHPQWPSRKTLRKSPGSQRFHAPRANPLSDFNQSARRLRIEAQEHEQDERLGENDVDGVGRRDLLPQFPDPTEERLMVPAHGGEITQNVGGDLDVRLTEADAPHLLDVEVTVGDDHLCGSEGRGVSRANSCLVKSDRPIPARRLPNRSVSDHDR